jgi:hypothetical protein
MKIIETTSDIIYDRFSYYELNNQMDIEKSLEFSTERNDKITYYFLFIRREFFDINIKAIYLNINLTETMKFIR